MLKGCHRHPNFRKPGICSLIKKKITVYLNAPVKIPTQHFTCLIAPTEERRGSFSMAESLKIQSLGTKVNWRALELKSTHHIITLETWTLDNKCFRFSNSEKKYNHTTVITNLKPRRNKWIEDHYIVWKNCHYKVTIRFEKIF